jgi:hypothetical protein
MRRKRKTPPGPEAKLMPIREDIMERDVIGPMIRRGRAEGRLEIVPGLIDERFGSVAQ